MSADADNPVVDNKLHYTGIKNGARNIHARYRDLKKHVEKLNDALDKFEKDYAKHVQHNEELCENSVKFGIWEFVSMWAEQIASDCRMASYDAESALYAGTKKNLESRAKVSKRATMTDPYENACLDLKDRGEEL